VKFYFAVISILISIWRLDNAATRQASLGGWRMDWLTGEILFCSDSDLDFI
jgi:hypothetical protein